MPQMGYDMQEGTVVRWRKQEGETVARGDIIAEIETDKATVEYEAFTGGVLGKIVAQEGAVVPVGELIAVITDPGEAVPDDIGAPAAGESPAPAPAADGRRDAAAPTPQAEPPPAAAAGDVRASPIARRLARERGIDLALVPGTGPGGRIVEEDVLGYREPAPEAPAGEVRASPLARRLARERGIDLARITGTGPGGRIVEEDVLGYQEPAPEPEAAPAEAEAGEERVELSRMRRTIARVTSDSKRQAPHFYVTAEVDMTRAAEFRREVNDASSEVRVSVNDLIVKAASIALGRYPKFNSSFQDDHLRMNSRINVGIAIALEDGLIVPGIDHCESKGLLEIAVASSDLISRANSGTLRNEEYSGSTFSVSNLGMFDVESFVAIIYPPHAAVLAVGTVKEQPVARGGEIVLAQMMKATLSVDHRVADGAEAAQFLMEIKRLLEHPINLVL
jgi:pyruvate dehydrogenase E2 component (dihydrolipoamide acetyltransferase)